MASGLGRKFCCLKYFLMSSNAFGLMIGIFLVLFGMAYQEQTFPGGYKGKETSFIAGVFIFITLIGYCGAHHQKIYFLVTYSLIIFIFVIGNVTLWLVSPSNSVLDPESRTVYVIGGLFLILMAIGIFLSWQIRRASRAESGNGTKPNQTDSPMDQSMSTLSPNPPPHIRTQQKVNNNYNQQQLQPQPQPAMTMVQHQYQSMHPSSSAQFVHQMVRGPPVMNPGIPGSFQ